MGLFDFLKKNNRSDVEEYYANRSKRGNADSMSAMSDQFTMSGQFPTGNQFTMMVDDVFTITGRGTVVTGRVSEGQISVGDNVSLLRRNGEVIQTTVIGIEAFRKLLDVARAGDNVGILLRGVSREGVAKGDKLYR